MAVFSELLAGIEAVGEELALDGDPSIRELVRGIRGADVHGHVAIGQERAGNPSIKGSTTPRQLRPHESFSAAALRIVYEQPGLKVREIVAALEDEGFPLPKKGGADRVRSSLWGKVRGGKAINRDGRYYPPDAPSGTERRPS